MKYDTSTLLLAAEVRRLALDLRIAKCASAWQPLHEAGSTDLPRDIWISREFAPQHPLTEYVPEAMKQLEAIAAAINQHHPD